MRIGFMYTVIRREEKLLLQELKQRDDVQVELLDDSKLVADLSSTDPPDLDVVLVRSLSLTRCHAAVRLFESEGVPCLNPSSVISTCGSKLETTLALRAADVAQPKVVVALSSEAALGAIEELGYPVVLKPVVGSWGRLLAKITDRDAAEAILEHRDALGQANRNVFYIQQFVDKRGSDIRAFVVGGECIAAIYRTSEHWITNTARGATASNCPLTPELRSAAEAGARAVGGTMVAVDLFETDDGLLVNEINHNMEFKNSIEPTGVDIPSLIVDHVLATARERAR